MAIKVSSFISARSSANSRFSKRSSNTRKKVARTSSNWSEKLALPKGCAKRNFKGRARDRRFRKLCKSAEARYNYVVTVIRKRLLTLEVKWETRRVDVIAYDYVNSDIGQLLPLAGNRRIITR